MSHVRAALFAALAFAALGAGACYAQNAGPRAVPGGANQGALSGGASGAANRGGAGGVANPDAGAARPEALEPGYGAGPAGTAPRRSGYLGGRPSPAEGGAPATGTTSSAFTGPSKANCHGANPARMSPSARLSGPNLERLGLAGTLAAADDEERSSRYLFAGLQEELAKTQPDLELAAAYLRIAAGVPVTPELVQRVTEALCVPLGMEQARSVSSLVELQRGRSAGLAR